MTRRSALLAAAAAAAIAWIGADPLPWPARAWVVALVVVAPVAGIVQGRMVRGLEHELPRGSAYASSAVFLWVLAAVTLLVAATAGDGPAGLGLRALPAARLLAWTGAATAAGLALMAAARWADARESEMLRALLPRTAREKAGFAVLSISAGLGEELAFRGFLVPALAAATGSTAAAVVVASLAFGLSHAYQGNPGIVRATLLGALLAAPFLLTGSLWPSILAHAALDLIAGLVLADWLLRR